MTDSIARLTQVLQQENAALAALDLPRATALLAEKQEALRLAATAVPSDSTSAELRELVQANRRLLERAIAVQGRVIELVATTLPPADSGRYARSGAASRGGPAVALAFVARA